MQVAGRYTEGVTEVKADRILHGVYYKVRGRSMWFID